MSSEILSQNAYLNAAIKQGWDEEDEEDESGSKPWWTPITAAISHMFSHRTAPEGLTSSPKRKRTDDYDFDESMELAMYMNGYGAPSPKRQRTNEGDEMDVDGTSEAAQSGQNNWQGLFNSFGSRFSFYASTQQTFVDWAIRALVYCEDEASMDAWVFLMPAYVEEIRVYYPGSYGDFVATAVRIPGGDAQTSYASDNHILTKGAIETAMRIAGHSDHQRC